MSGAKSSYSNRKAAWVGLYVGWGGVSRDLQTGSNISQVEGISGIAPAYHLSVALRGKGSEEEQWLTPMPDTSASPHVPLVPFVLPPRHWSSEGESLSRRVRV